MAKLQITLPDEMQSALQKASDIEDRVIAAIVRRAIADYLLKTHNIQVDPKMEWGGARKSDDSDTNE